MFTLPRYCIVVVNHYTHMKSEEEDTKTRPFSTKKIFQMRLGHMSDVYNGILVKAI